jgi:hypothetical protein
MAAKFVAFPIVGWSLVSVIRMVFVINGAESGPLSRGVALARWALQILAAMRLPSPSLVGGEGRSDLSKC